MKIKDFTIDDVITNEGTRIGLTVEKHEKQTICRKIEWSSLILYIVPDETLINTITLSTITASDMENLSKAFADLAKLMRP